MTNIALIGYGSMGRELERLAPSRHLSFKKIISSDANRDGRGISAESLKGVDVCIEFTHPAVVMTNIKAIIAQKKNLVVGTTGWYDRFSEVRTMVEQSKIGMVYASNFSIGMNLFYKIVGEASRLIDAFDEYDVAISETHHRAKADSPSGTALTLAQIVVRNIKRKKEIEHEAMHGSIRPDQIHVTSTRIGTVAGRHQVLFDADADSIELIHTAKNRSGFALGALIAAEWIKGKRGLYAMSDVIESI